MHSLTLSPAACLMLALTLAMPLGAWAEGSPARPPADPSDPAAPVPALNPAGSLARYRRPADLPPASWPVLNEKVRQAGGWRAYARETRVEADRDVAPGLPALPALPASVPAPTAPRPSGHAHH